MGWLRKKQKNFHLMVYIARPNIYNRTIKGQASQRSSPQSDWKCSMCDFKAGIAPNGMQGVHDSNNLWLIPGYRDLGCQFVNDEPVSISSFGALGSDSANASKARLHWVSAATKAALKLLGPASFCVRVDNVKVFGGSRVSACESGLTEGNARIRLAQIAREHPEAVIRVVKEVA